MDCSQSKKSYTKVNLFSDFYCLYNKFLIVDKVVSLTNHGRDRSIIHKFFLLHLNITSNKFIENKNEILKFINDINKTLNEYLLKYRKFKIVCDYEKDTRITKIEEKKVKELNKAFKDFYLAANLYTKHRKNMSDDDLKSIFEKMITDYTYGVFEKTDDSESCIENFHKCFEDINIKKITNLKQALMEFNNAISHIVRADYKQENEEEKNIIRAINHLERGTLDYYKSIIKEFYFLDNISVKNEKILQHIRCREFNSIGNTKIDIIKFYEEFIINIVK